MKSSVTILVVSILSVLVNVAIAEQFNPLEDYKEVEAATNIDMPTPDQVAQDQQAMVKRGEYLVELLGCGSCHTDGALIGKPDLNRVLAGSSVGIAYTSPFKSDNPAVVFPRNLTPDPSGLGGWTDEEVADAIQAGAGQHGGRRILVMPWQRYARIHDQDIDAIVAYLRNLEPVAHKVPDPVPQGMRSENLYVHFGVYLSREFE